MKLSLEWISDYVDIKEIDPYEVADKLTVTTAEIEDVIPIKRHLKKVVVGEVVSSQRIRENKPLFDVCVNCGDRTARTITGRKSLPPGTKIAFATPGAVLNRGRYVEIKEIAGAESQGKLCTADDLALEEGNRDVVQLPDNMENGRLLETMIPEVDYLLEIDNKSITHRPDLWGHYGFAREVAAIYERTLKSLNIHALDHYQTLPPVNVVIEDQERCKAYCCLRIGNLVRQPSPLHIQSRLCAIGLRPLNLVVDLTNYIAHELGQPMHAFDGNKVNRIRVDRAGREINLKALDGKPYQLLADDLLILGENDRPLAIAGIIGGLDSSVTDETTAILLESANFDGASVRKTSRRLALFTEAGKRFEKQQPASNSALALKRFCHLLEQAQPGLSIESSLTIKGDLETRPRSVELPLNFLRKRMGIPISAAETIQKLETLGFKARERDGHITVVVPPFRSAKDISLKEDILEEVSRLYGYDRIPPKLPVSVMQNRHVDPIIVLERTIRLFLSQQHRFQEVQTYNWYDDTFLHQIGYQPQECLTLVNPATPHHSRLRDSMLPNLLGVAHKNADHTTEKRIYEIGRMFKAGRETSMLSALCYEMQESRGPDTFFFSLKGIVEELLEHLGYDRWSESHETAKADCWGSNASYLEIRVDQKPIGRLGFVSPDICRELIPGSQMCWFEFDLDRMTRLHSKQICYAPLSKFPGSRFDFSLLFPQGTSYAEIERQLDRFQHDLSVQRSYLYQYKGQGITDGWSCYTFRFDVSSPLKTLTGDELKAFHQQLTDFFAAEDIAVR